MSDSHAHLLPPMRSFAESLGFTVSSEWIPGVVGGWCDQNVRRMVIDADAPANAAADLRPRDGSRCWRGYAEYGRERAEAIVDTAIAYRGVGLKVEYESIPYIAGWGETGELDAATVCAQDNR